MLRKNTAGQFVHIAGVNVSTGAVVTGATWTMRRCLDGTFAAGGATITEDTGTGFYKVALTQADTNGNDIGYFFTATNCVPVTLNVVTTACDPTSTAFGLILAKTTNITGFNDLTAAQIATGVWQDSTAGDFTAASSIGKSLYTSGNAPGAASGLALVGSNMGTVTSVTGAVGSVTGNVGGNVTGSVGSVVGAVGSVTGNVGGNVSGSVGSVVASVTLTSDYDFAKGTAAMTEAYAANGVAPSPVQALFAIHQYLMQFGISTTNYTVKKLDNTTTAFVVTLDSATTPAAAART